MNRPKPRLKALQTKLQALADPQKAAHAQRFFKTGPGEYGEGERFLGIRVPEIRRLARKYRDLDGNSRLRLLQSPLHEERLLALLLLVDGYRWSDRAGREQIYRLYLANTRHINNWDLVDCSAEHIVGAHLRGHSHDPLFQLAQSPLLWERRIAIMASFHFIKRGRFDTTLDLAERLLQDPHDLIHKAVGWMLREVGKRNLELEARFLQEHYRLMPRTMLRYAIERFPEDLRKKFLAGRIEPFSDDPV